MRKRGLYAFNMVFLKGSFSCLWFCCFFFFLIHVGNWVLSMLCLECLGYPENLGLYKLIINSLPKWKDFFFHVQVYFQALVQMFSSKTDVFFPSEIFLCGRIKTRETGIWNAISPSVILLMCFQIIQMLRNLAAASPAGVCFTREKQIMKGV